MDGNGRWAKKRGLPKMAGHHQGVKTIEEVLNACREFGIKMLTLYAFSTENWKRPKKEVATTKAADSVNILVNLGIFILFTP